MAVCACGDLAGGAAWAGAGALEDDDGGVYHRDPGDGVAGGAAGAFGGGIALAADLGAGGGGAALRRGVECGDGGAVSAAGLCGADFRAGGVDVYQDAA